MRVPPTSSSHRAGPRATRRRLLATLCLAMLASPSRATDVEVQTQRQGDTVEVRAQATLRAPWALVWGTLTDYERLPEFIPGLHSSRVLSRQGATAVVEQQGEASFLFLRVPIDVVVESTERPPFLEVRRLRGTLRQLQGHYELRVLPDKGWLQLRWNGTIAPEQTLPPLVGEALVRMSIRAQFEGMVDEIARREAARTRGAATSARPVPASPGEQQGDR